MSERESREAQTLQSLERGLAVLQVFSSEHPALTLSEVARLSDTSRATARRILLTLERLGHVRSDGRLFRLTPRVLSLGWAYLSSLDVWTVVQPLMQELVALTGESCSAAALDLPDIVYVARVPTQRIMSITIGVGTRLPAHATSMGRVLLAELAPEESDAFMRSVRLERYTSQTNTDPDRLCEELTSIRARGWACVDQELEMGLRSAAAPLRGGDGRAVAALNVSAAAARVSLKDLRSKLVPQLLETAGAISLAIARSAGARVEAVPPAV